MIIFSIYTYALLTTKRLIFPHGFRLTLPYDYYFIVTFIVGLYTFEYIGFSRYTIIHLNITLYLSVNAQTYFKEIFYVFYIENKIVIE